MTKPWTDWMLRSIGAGLALAALAAPAQAWEVINSGLPTFAAIAPPGLSGEATGAAAPGGVQFETVNGWNPGYSYRLGGKYLLGFEQKSGWEAGGSLLGMASGFDYSSSNVKVGYDMGAFKPFVSASFAQARAPAFGANLFAGPPGAANPFAPSASATTVGAGFDYALTDKLSFGVSVSATQVSGWQR